jgi:ubiquinone/menaquinone biosynthesis C-methylase UbiE
VAKKACSSNIINYICTNIIDRIDNRNYKYVEDYESAKYYDSLPRFSSNIYDYFENELGIKNAIVADIGAGTGRVTIDLLERGNKVYAVDPDENMRKICTQKCSSYKNNYISIKGNAVNTHIKDKSIDYVICSQSFHCFDEEKFKKECQRILKNKNNVIILWYRVDFNNPIIAEMLKSIKENYKNYKTRYDNKSEVDGSLAEAKIDNSSARHFYNGKSKMKDIMSKAILSEEEFISLGLSLSLFPITHDMNTVSKLLESDNFNKNKYINDLKNIFKKYSKNNLIELDFNVQIHSHK